MNWVAGQAFIPDVPGHKQDHLYVLLTDPDPGGFAIVVNLTDARNIEDSTTVVPTGTSITSSFTTTKESAVNYAEARLVSFDSLWTVFAGSSVSHVGAVSMPTVVSMRKGLMESSFSNPKVKTFARSLGW